MSLYILNWFIVNTNGDNPIRNSVAICYYSCAVSHMSYKMGSVSSFWCYICACKFMHAYIYHAMFRVGGGKELFEIFSSSWKNSFVVLGKWVERFK